MSPRRSSPPRQPRPVGSPAAGSGPQSAGRGRLVPPGRPSIGRLALVSVGVLVPLLVAAAVIVALEGQRRDEANRGILYADSQGLWLVDPEATTRGARRMIVGSRGKGDISDPAWSPDRSLIAYAFQPVATAGVRYTFGSDIYVVRPDGSNPRAVFIHEVDSGLARAPAWTPDGKALYFAYSFGDGSGKVERQLIRLDLASGERTVIATNYDQPTVAPDGSQVAAVLVGIRSGIGLPASGGPSSLWLLSTDGGQARSLVPPGQFEAIWAPRFSPDGRSILFSANGGDRSRPRLSPPPPRKLGLDWPPSVAASGPVLDLWLVDVATGRLELLVALANDHTTGAWSPDGHRVAYLSTMGLFVLDLRLGEVLQLSEAPLDTGLDWSR